MDGAARLLGREAEERQIGALLAAARNGRGGSLLLLGEPGIGKTALLGRRRGPRDARAAGAGYEAESTIPYAALHRLMLPLRQHLPRCRSRTSRRCGWPPGRPRARRRTGSWSGWACSGCSPRPSEEAPLVCAVDDAHHLDAESLEALAFVARRLEAESAALVFAGRDEPRLIERAAGVPVLHLPGLRRMPRSSLLQSRLPEPIDPAAAAQIAAATGGNPLALIDLASELDARRLTESSLADEPVPVGHHLEAYYLRRVRHLDPRRPAVAARGRGRLHRQPRPDPRRPPRSSGSPTSSARAPSWPAW